MFPIPQDKAFEVAPAQEILSNVASYPKINPSPMWTLTQDMAFNVGSCPKKILSNVVPYLKIILLYCAPEARIQPPMWPLPQEESSLMWPLSKGKSFSIVAPTPG